MLSSKKLKALQKYIDIIELNKGKALGEIFKSIPGDAHKHFKKGASGLIIENLLGLENSGSPKADLEYLKVEIKVLPINLSNLKAKEPTQIKMINYMEVIHETWESATIRDKIETIFWVVYGVNKTNGKFDPQTKYILLDWFIDVPEGETQKIFQKDWEEIVDLVKRGKAEELSCSMGVYIEPKTKGKNHVDVRDAPDVRGGVTKARRRAFYFKKNYTNSKIISQLDLQRKKK